MDANEITLKASLFFENIDPLWAAIFGEQQNVWFPLQGGIPDFFASQNPSQTNQIDGQVSQDAYLLGKGIIIRAGAVVEPGAYIKGPAYIGEGTHVRHGAYIRGNVIAGKNCVIGHATEIKHALMLDGAKAGHFAYVGDSILGHNVNLGAGTKLANLKVFRGNIHVYHRGEKINTGLRKFGAILGDGVEMGCNSVANPGTILGKKSVVYPCVSVKGLHIDRAVIKA